MRNRSLSVAMAMLSAMLILGGICTEAAAQISSQRGISSRGVNRVGTQRAPMQARGTRPMNSQPMYRGGANVNPGGPLNINLAPYMAAPMYMFDPSMSLAPGDAALQGDYGLEGGELRSGSPPSIRPRLNVADRNALNSPGVLRNIRDTVLKQIAKCPEKPFSPEWHAAHASVAPVRTLGGNAWGHSNWTEVTGLVGLDAEPVRYDFRPDSRGLIFVYRGEAPRERAVDARGPAAQLAASASPAEGEPAGLSLGVFAAVPPVEAPVQSLLHLVVSEPGTVVGYVYHFSTDSVQPLRGAVDRASQRVAWQVDSTVMETGLSNLVEDVSRALVFRDDGWTQSWILMRISDSPPAGPGPLKQ